jgi:hypothetical protein
MNLSLVDAQTAIQEVLAAYDAYVPAELKLAVARKPVNVTEYATRSINPTIARERAGRYETNDLKTKSWVDRSAGNRDMALRLMFQGVGGGSKAVSQAMIANTLQSLLP